MYSVQGLVTLAALGFQAIYNKVKRQSIKIYTVYVQDLVTLAALGSQAIIQ